MDSNTGNLPFPWKLHVLLDDAENPSSGGGGFFHDIVSWVHGGLAFKVHDKERFSHDILPRYFHTDKYKSFQRNLNLWGFQTETRGPNKGSIFNSLFAFGRPELCHLMKRSKTTKPQQERTATTASTTNGGRHPSSSVPMRFRSLEYPPERLGLVPLLSRRGGAVSTTTAAQVSPTNYVLPPTTITEPSSSGLQQVAPEVSAFAAPNRSVASWNSSAAISLGHQVVQPAAPNLSLLAEVLGRSPVTAPPTHGRQVRSTTIQETTPLIYYMNNNGGGLADLILGPATGSTTSTSSTRRQQTILDYVATNAKPTSLTTGRSTEAGNNADLLLKLLNSLARDMFVPAPAVQPTTASSSWESTSARLLRQQAVSSDPRPLVHARTSSESMQMDRAEYLIHTLLSLQGNI